MADMDGSSEPAEWLTFTPQEIEKRYKWIETVQGYNLARGMRAQNKYTTCTDNVIERTRFGLTPFLHNRVKLAVKEPLNDYFSGSDITLSFGNTQDVLRCIATQHPQPSTIAHFWQMVHELKQDVVVIVMLVQNWGGSKYVPSADSPVTFKIKTGTRESDTLLAKLEVVEASFHEQAKTQVTKLNLTVEGRTTTVYHFHFQNWPDHGVPALEDTPALINMISLMQEKLGTQAFANAPARIVHCLAGIGRTGTFIALEHLLHELSLGLLFDTEDPYDPILDIVMHLRDARPFMVEQVVQFEFLYKVLRLCYTIAVGDGEEGSAKVSGQTVPKITGEQIAEYLKKNEKEPKGPSEKKAESKDPSSESGSSESSLPERKKAKVAEEGEAVRAKHEHEHPAANLETTTDADTNQAP